MNTREFIKKCDADFRERLYLVAREVVRSFESDRRIRLVSLSGPTCSGKTTAAAMLAEYIESHGKRVHIISIDDFFYSREYLHTLALESGTDEIDYDSEKTIDLEEFERFTLEALSGESVHCPIYDFKKGERDGYREISSGKDDVFIFEGIQAIYPCVTELLYPHGYISLYIAPATPICCGTQTFLPDEIRLLRRIVRDAHKRGTAAEFTMQLWESVRRNEEKNIFPYADTCTYRIDSTHEYEIGVLKPYLEDALREVESESEHYREAKEILRRIENIAPISDKYIDENSLYREFV